MDVIHVLEMIVRLDNDKDCLVNLEFNLHTNVKTSPHPSNLDLSSIRIKSQVYDFAWGDVKKGKVFKENIITSNIFETTVLTTDDFFYANTYLFFCSPKNFTYYEAVEILKKEFTKDVLNSFQQFQAFKQQVIETGEFYWGIMQQFTAENSNSFVQTVRGT